MALSAGLLEDAALEEYVALVRSSAEESVYSLQPGTAAAGAEEAVISVALLSTGTEALGSGLIQFIEETLGNRRFSWTEVWLGPFDSSVSELKNGIALTLVDSQRIPGACGKALGVPAFAADRGETASLPESGGGGVQFRKKSKVNIDL